MVSLPQSPESPRRIERPAPVVERALEAPGGRRARFLLRIAAESLLLKRPADQPGCIARVLRRAAIDLNPHQIEAAVNAIKALETGGLVLADEVGLGKTIEAGLVLAQLAAEGRPHLLVLTPATLRRQWAEELEHKLGVSSIVVDGALEARERRSRRDGSVFDRPGQVVIASHPFAARRAEELARIPWSVAILDEAHRLRGAHRGSKTARALRAALEPRPKLLLTATPLQNGLGELYGLLSFLDPDLLGPFEEFRRVFPDTSEPDEFRDLKARLGPYVHRTLRRQVKEYVRYTDRKSVVVRFSPTADERALYDEVSTYLGEPDTLAIDPARRPLMVMVYRKLLASSPAAIAGTLEHLAGTLRDRLMAIETRTQADRDADALLDQLEDDGVEFEASPDGPSDASPSRIKGELDRLERLAALARSIERPSKTAALLGAIDKIFIDAVSRGWPEKIVLFTESRRTQDALERALLQAGHSVVVLHGASGDADARAKIVDDFRHRAKILILTEAGAEGLNLQFANVVVNYDLPWNPQRIEQRIGRCHRYGQLRDVIVLNFLADDNAAEERLYELLSHKLRLFDGVFGATDEPLGALGDGADLERKIFEILGECRSEAAIKSAFDALQAELEGRIQARYREAQAQLVEHFDDEIRSRLRLTDQQTNAALEKDEAALVELVKGSLPGAELDEDGRFHIVSADGTTSVIETARRRRQRPDNFLTVDHPIAARLITDLREDSASDIRYLAFEYTRHRHKISRLAPLLGSEGWWLVYKVGFQGVFHEEHLVHVVLAKTPEGRTHVFDDAQTESLLQVTATEVPKRARMKAMTLASTHAEPILEKRVAELSSAMRTRADAELKKARGLVDLTLEDTLKSLRALTVAKEEEWKKARARGEDGEPAYRELARALEREANERKKAMKRRADRRLELDERSRTKSTRSLVATAYFWLE